MQFFAPTEEWREQKFALVNGVLHNGTLCDHHTCISLALLRIYRLQNVPELKVDQLTVQ